MKKADKKNFKPVGELSMDELRQLSDYLLRVNKNAVEPTGRMTRSELIAYVESLRIRPGMARAKKPRVKKKTRMTRNLGVGRRCREILATVVGRGEHGPIGLSYTKMVEMVQKEFPTSAVDERHLRWYATKARAEGMAIPADRPRSSWLHQYEPKEYDKLKARKK